MLLLTPHCPFATSLQLPPVCFCKRNGHGDDDDTPTHCEKCDITRSELFMNATKHKLPVSIRHQDDPEFSAFLSTARCEVPSQQLIDATFTYREQQLDGTSVERSCFMDADTWLDHASAQDTILCSHLQDVVACNQHMLDKAFNASDIVHLPGCLVAPRNAAGASAPPPDVQAWADDPRFNLMPCAAVGARVMCTENNPDLGVVNGSLGVITEFCSRGGFINKVCIQPDGTDKVVDILRTQTSKPKFFDGKPYQRKTFPLVLAYAMTGHKVSACLSVTQSMPRAAALQLCLKASNSWHA